MSATRKPSKIVREGYDRIAPAYLAARSRGRPDPPLLAELARLLPTDALILDAGCGAGLPVTRALAQTHNVVGIDFSLAQLRLASELVPAAVFACQDMTRLGFASGVFDAVCSFYAILHVPRTEHKDLLTAFRRLLKNSGFALLCLGAEDNEADYAPYMGTTMFWSHYDSATYLQMLADLGFQTLSSQIVQDPISTLGAHLFALVQKHGA